MQPGQTVSPGGTPEEPSWQFNPAAQPTSSLPQPQAPSPELSAPVPEPLPTPDTPQPAPATPTNTDGPAVSWTASEFIAHNKSAGWYMLLMVGSIVFAAAVYLLTRDVVSSSVIIVLAIIFAIAAARKPRELQYQVDNQGILIGPKNYPYQIFRSFAIVQEEGVESIWFMPLKRFMPIVSIYFDPQDGDKIVDILSQSLPIEEHQPELVDRLMHRIHF